MKQTRMNEDSHYEYNNSVVRIDNKQKIFIHILNICETRIYRSNNRTVLIIVIDISVINSRKRSTRANFPILIRLGQHYSKLYEYLHYIQKHPQPMKPIPKYDSHIKSHLHIQKYNLTNQSCSQYYARVPYGVVYNTRIRTVYLNRS